MLEYIIIGVIAFGAGWKLRELYALRQIFKMMKSGEVTQSEETPKTVLKLEKHSDVIFAYNKETDEFLGQGDTLTSLSDALRERFPNTSFAVTEENLKELGLNNEPI